MKQVLFVGLGGAAGSMLRYAASMVTERYYAASFPLATFLINGIGCFLAGLIFGFTVNDAAQGHTLRLLLITGFCGGFTTFSAFALENVRLIHAGHTSVAIAYTSASVVAGLVAAWLGLWLAR